MRITVALAPLLLLTAITAPAQAAQAPLSGSAITGEQSAAEAKADEGFEKVAKQLRSKGSSSLSRNQSRPSLSRQAPRRIGQNSQPLFKDRNRSDSGPQRVQPLPKQPNR